MEKLFIKTKNQKQEISSELINKYKLEAGDITPFSKNKITDKQGLNKKKDKKKKNPPKEDLPYDNSDGIIELPGGAVMSTSEIIDISQGTDSSQPVT